MIQFICNTIIIVFLSIVIIDPERFEWLDWQLYSERESLIAMIAITIIIWIIRCYIKNGSSIG